MNPRHKQIAIFALMVIVPVLVSQASPYINGLYPSQGFYYQTKVGMLGLPLLDVRIPPQKPPQELSVEQQLDYCAARGVIAIGPLAIGIFAFGLGSAGVVSIGILSFALYASFGVLGVSAWKSYAVKAFAPNPIDVSRQRKQISTSK